MATSVLGLRGCWEETEAGILQQVGGNNQVRGRRKNRALGACTGTALSRLIPSPGWGQNEALKHHVIAEPALWD